MDTNNKNSLRLSSLLYIIVAIIGIGALVAWFLPSEQKISTPGFDQSESLSGYVYLTLYPKVPDGKVFKPTVSRFNLEQKNLQYSDSPDITITPTVSPDRTHIAYAGIPFAEHDTENLQIRIANRDSTHERDVTHSPTLYKRTPRWSPDGKHIAFVAIKDKEINPLIPNNWQVYMTDLEGNEELMTTGANPYFTPDGKSLLVLKNEGLSLVDIASKKEKIVWSMEGGDASISMSFNLSSNGEWLAWPDPDDAKILIIRISSWDPFYAEIVTTIPMRGVWPVFSPNARYLAFQQVDMDKDIPDTDKSHRLVVYDLAKNLVAESVELVGYLPNKTFITDWTESTP